MTVETVLNHHGFQPVAPDGHFSRLLIVEDDPAQLRTLTKIMEAEGFAVVGCSSAHEGLRQLRASLFGVIIIDLNLPDLNGIALAEQIRQIDERARIIVHTGYGSFTSAKALINVGVFAFVEKLSDPQELVAHVHRAAHGQIAQYAKELEQAVAERTNQLRETALWLDLAQTAAGIGTWDWDLETQTARCSATCLRLLYGREVDIQKMTLRKWLRYVHPEDSKRVLKEVLYAIHKHSIYQSEFRVVWPDGTVHWIANRGQVLYNVNGEPLRFIGAALDVTERIEAQYMLHRAYNDLETHVQERTAELQQTNLRLREEIEERRKTEQALQLANFSLDHAADAIIFAGPDAKLFYVNEAVCRMHGYTRTELLTMRVHELSPVLGQWLVDHWSDVGNTIPMLTQECWNHTNDGRMFPVEFTVKFLEFNGAAYRCVIMRDITTRKAAEAQRAQQTLALMSLWKANIFKQGHFAETIQEITRVAADTLKVERVGVWLFSNNRTKLQCIDLYEAITEQHSVGNELWAVDYPQYFQALEKERIIAAHDACHDPRTVECAANYLIPLGIASMLNAPIRIDEGLAGVLCHEHIGSPRVWTLDEQSFANSLADILAIAIQTDKRFLVEQKLRESEELRDLAIRGADIALWDWNVATGAIVVDERWAALRGYRLDEIEYHVDFWLSLVHPDDRAELKLKLNKHLAGETPDYETEYRTQTKTGQWRWILSRGKVVAWDELGQPLRFLGTQMDITTYKHLEQQLLQAQKMEAVGRLAGGVAHDFNNMLTVIISYSELVLRRSDLEERTRLRIEEIKKAGERAALLTQQLLTFSRKQVMTPVSLDLNLVVTEMDQMLRRLISEDIALHLRLDPAACWIKADPVQMEQVIMNLVINARDAMPEGGWILIQTKKVQMPTTAPQLHHTRATTDYVLLTVTDNGAGMDAETQGRIFEPFFTTKELGKGTGLGLSMVFGIIHQHNGYIEVESALAQGTTFRIYLPFVETISQVSSTLPALPDSASVGEETILLVEDEEQIRSLACAALQEAGYTVLVAANGQTACALVRQQQKEVHLLVTDVVMPGMNGVQLAQAIHEIYPTIKTLYLSGYADNKLSLPSLELSGRIAYLPKPFTPSLLTQKVREVLDG